MRILLLIFLLCAVSTGIARNSSPTPANEMLLLDESSSGGEPRVTPMEMLRKFFSGVKSGNLDDALNALTRDSLLAHKKDDIETLKKGTQQALDKYGDVEGFEILEKKAVGDSLLRVTGLSLGEDMPLRWRFYFYKIKGNWRLLDMRVDTGIADLFEDIGSNK
jgi:hypothetical protein